MLKIGSISRRHLFIFSTSILLFLCVVIPNSMQSTSAVALIITAIIASVGLKINRNIIKLFWFFVLTVLVTAGYLIVGELNGAPQEALIQIPVIYIVSPFLWILVSIQIFQSIGSERLIGWFAVYTLLCGVSIIVFFWLFEQYGPNAVSFFKSDGANLSLQDGYAGATMHVYGSLIFLSAGFISSPEVIQSFKLRIIVIAVICSAALTSGRAALILSIPIGLLSLLLLTPRTIELSKYQRKKSYKNLFRALLAVTAGVGLVIYLASYYTDINIPYIISAFYEKLGEGGGGERIEQAKSLVSGIIETNGLGAGHGIGVEVVRSEINPWRYELVWLATIYRVGFIGAAIYAILFFHYIFSIIRVARSRKLLMKDKFFFSAFVAAFVASNTNPYIEGFAFQWMFIVPLISFYCNRGGGYYRNQSVNQRIPI